MSTSDWIEYWKVLHGDFTEGWDAFMAMSTTFYSPDLAPFVEQLQGAGTPFLATKYTGALDGEPLFSIMAVVPNTGQLLEVVSEQLESDDLRSLFADGWPAGSCAAANDVGVTVEKMKAAWDAHNGERVNPLGLPDLLVVKVSTPAVEPNTMLAS